MSDVSTSIAPRAPALTPDKPKRLQVRGKLVKAIRYMIEGGGHDFAEAARVADMHAASIRNAFQKPHVIAYVRQQTQVFRTAVCTKNVSRLAELRDQDDNRSAAVQAVRALERLSEVDEARPSSHEAPGLVIVVQTHVHQTADLDAASGKPLIEQTVVRRES